MIKNIMIGIMALTIFFMGWRIHDESWRATWGWDNYWKEKNHYISTLWEIKKGEIDKLERRMVEENIMKFSDKDNHQL